MLLNHELAWTPKLGFTCFLFFKAEVPVKLRQGIDPTEVSLFPAEGQEGWEQEWAWTLASTRTPE